MSRSGIILAILLAVAGCHGHSQNLFRFEEDFLFEDTVEFMTIVFQAGERGFTGDAVDPADVVEDAGPGNDFTATYDLPEAMRLGLGEGFGRVAIRVEEDGVPSSDPIGFSVASTDALVVEVVYELQYEGETSSSARDTDVDLTATLTATRASAADPFRVEYFVVGDCFLGATFCRISARFFAEGRPRDGIEPGVGDASGIIDDPEVIDVFDMDLDFGTDLFRAQGDVGCCAIFEEDILYDLVF